MIYILPKGLRGLIDFALKDESLVRQRLFYLPLSYRFNNEIVKSRGILGFECDADESFFKIYLNTDFFLLDANCNLEIDKINISFEVVEQGILDLNDSSVIFKLPSDDFLDCYIKSFLPESKLGNEIDKKPIYICKLRDLLNLKLIKYQTILIGNFSEDIYDFIRNYSFENYKHVRFNNLVLNIDEDDDLDGSLVFIDDLMLNNVFDRLIVRFYLDKSKSENVCYNIKSFNFPENVNFLFNIWHTTEEYHKNLIEKYDLKDKITLEINDYFV